MKGQLIYGIIAGFVGYYAYKMYIEGKNKPKEGVVETQTVTTNITPQNGYSALLNEYDIVVPSSTNLKTRNTIRQPKRERRRKNQTA
jgi:hypothetical protein